MVSGTVGTAAPLPGWLLLRQAQVANDALLHVLSDQDQQFYEGKITAARFFARTALPQIAAARVTVAGADFGVMDLPEDAF
ncbi:acyl-CoA dehydrogenase C-terminal domain-containing protein [Mycolicibacterium vaccae]|uniref:acyl-CoA dehydrogenase C-terminal domain-containing protein n=1 Tax=Mycolicibacterium vaccae TaxID=1810 RepID=UPI0009DAA0B1|nr:acyl-CoA dehydrogenase C-terminal domain-containing protein [Mycolicibacterium vaccae]